MSPKRGILRHSQPASDKARESPFDGGSKVKADDSTTTQASSADTEATSSAASSPPLSAVTSASASSSQAEASPPVLASPAPTPAGKKKKQPAPSPASPAGRRKPRSNRSTSKPKSKGKKGSVKPSKKSSKKGATDKRRGDKVEPQHQPESRDGSPPLSETPADEDQSQASPDDSSPNRQQPAKTPKSKKDKRRTNSPTNGKHNKKKKHSKKDKKDSKGNKSQNQGSSSNSSKRSQINEAELNTNQNRLTADNHQTDERGNNEVKMSKESKCILKAYSHSDANMNNYYTKIKQTDKVDNNTDRKPTARERMAELQWEEFDENNNSDDARKKKKKKKSSSSRKDDTKSKFTKSRDDTTANPTDETNKRAVRFDNNSKGTKSSNTADIYGGDGMGSLPESPQIGSGSQPKEDVFEKSNSLISGNRKFVTNDDLFKSYSDPSAKTTFAQSEPGQWEKTRRPLTTCHDASSYNYSSTQSQYGGDSMSQAELTYLATNPPGAAGNNPENVGFSRNTTTSEKKRIRFQDGTRQYDGGRQSRCVDGSASLLISDKVRLRPTMSSETIDDDLQPPSDEDGCQCKPVARRCPASSSSSSDCCCCDDDYGQVESRRSSAGAPYAPNTTFNPSIACNPTNSYNPVNIVNIASDEILKSFEKWQNVIVSRQQPNTLQQQSMEIPQQNMSAASGG
jgi:hypothetical protein